MYHGAATEGGDETGERAEIGYLRRFRGLGWTEILLFNFGFVHRSNIKNRNLQTNQIVQNFSTQCLVGHVIDNSNVIREEDKQIYRIYSKWRRKNQFWIEFVEVNNLVKCTACTWSWKASIFTKSCYLLHWDTNYFRIIEKPSGEILNHYVTIFK